MNIRAVPKIKYYFLFVILFLLFSDLFSQSFYFGRNKVQYTDFDWQILKTKNFDIYYYPEMKDIAEKGAVFAEEIYNELEVRFNYTLVRRIPLILYSSHSHFQQTNITPGFIPEGVGGFFEFMKGRVVVPGNGDIKRFRRVIRHELVHVFMHGKLYNQSTLYETTDALNPPLWFTEGLAEFWSGGWDSQGEMVLKDAVLGNNIVGLERIYAYTGTYFMYKVGQDVLTFIADNYGPDKILLLMENMWKHDVFEDNFKEVIGLSYREFDLQYISFLKKRYFPLMAEQDYNAVVTPTIVRQGYNFKPVYYNENGNEYVVSIGNRDGYSSIYQTPYQPVSTDNINKAKRLIKGESSSDYEAFHIFDSKIDVSPNGMLTFSAKSGERDVLYLYDIKSMKQIDAISFKHLAGILSPNWSADGSTITFSGLGMNGYLDIYTYRPASKKLTRLTKDFYADTDPVFSPDGNYVAFSSDRTSGSNEDAANIVLMELQNGKMYHLTIGNQKDKSPEFSKDGKHLVYTSDLSGTSNIYLIKNPLDLSNGRSTLKSYQLTNFVGSTFDPCWVDSSRILYSTYENNSFQIRSLENFMDCVNQENEVIQPMQFTDNDWQYQNIEEKNIKARTPYITKYTLDFAQSQVSQNPIWGTSGGAQFAFTDLMGNEQYFVTIFNNAQVASDFWKSFNVAVQRVSLKKRLNFGIGLYRFAGYYYNPEDFYYYEESVGTSLILSYPLSHFARVSLTQQLYYSDKDRFYTKSRLAYINSSFLSFIYDNSIWGPSGPMDGTRINFTFGNTYDFVYANVNYYTGLIDIRKYFRTSLQTAYAVRFLTLFNQGTEARQYYFGGSWDLRLYRRWSLHGKKIFLLSQELRFPLANFVAVQLPFTTIGFRSVRGALFVDAGNAWNEDFPGLRGSFGLGVRVNLGGFLVLRWDIGRKTDFKSINGTTETHFFFGWDF